MTNNLPLYPTPILGRERESAELARAISDSQVVTIVGAGGIGKTRIAVQAAGDVDVATDGTWFVNLESLADPSLVPATIANALGLEIGESADSASALAAELATRNPLIVLDNCEHLVEPCARLVQLIVASCPRVRVLATSREPLGVVGERVYRLETLDLPTSVALFLERAKQVDERFEFSDDDAAVLAEVCRRLDGIALAIELVAARAPFMSLNALLARLDERFRSLGGGSHATAPQKHQTLRALIEWSHELLTVEQKALFRRLGVFNGGFSLDAAGRVTGHGIDEASVLELLTVLVDKSMIVPSPGQSERYRMLEPIRQYAARRLRESADADSTRRYYTHYFAELSSQVAMRFGVDTEESWLARYEPDLDNFRAVLELSLRPNPALAATIVGNLKEFWYHSNLISEGLARSQTVLAALDPEDESAMLPVLLAVASLGWRAGDGRYSFQAGERALAIARRMGDPAAVATARYMTGWALFKLGEPARAARELHDALAFFRTQDQPLRTLLVSIDYAIALKRTDPARGYQMLQEALATAQGLGWPRATLRTEIALAEYEFAGGDGSRAVSRARRVVEACRSRNSAYALTVALLNLGSYLSIAEEYDAAREAARESAIIGRTHHIQVAVEWAIQSLALCLTQNGDDPRTAARLLGHVDAFVDELGSKREPTEALVRERLIEILRRYLDDAALDTEIAAGRELSTERACAIALGEEAID